MRKKWLSVVLLVSTLGCAHIDIHKLKPGADDSGLRFYRPKPYLWVMLGEAGCTPSIEYLPDYSNEYIIEPHYWLGTVTFKPTLDKGWNLIAYDSTVDTKIPETINAFAGLLKEAGSIATTAGAAPAAAGDEGGAPPQPAFGPGLYTMTFDHQTGALTGITPIFQVTDARGRVISCTPPAPKAPPKK